MSKLSTENSFKESSRLAHGSCKIHDSSIRLESLEDRSRGRRIYRPWIINCRSRGGTSTRPHDVSRLNFRPTTPSTVAGSRAGVAGRTIVPVAGNVGLARPIIPRGRICLIYYIHCAIHRKRLPTLYCGRWKLATGTGERAEPTIEREREGDGGKTGEGWRETGRRVVSPNSQVAAFNLFLEE